jgi:hypothetical protein
MLNWNKPLLILVGAIFVIVITPWRMPAQNIKSGVVNSRNQILGVTTNQQVQSRPQNFTDPPAGKGNPGPLPCNSKNNPKCSPASPSKPGERGNNGVGNGVDPQPPGNPPINDAPGTGPGNPGARSR